MLRRKMDSRHASVVARDNDADISVRTRVRSRNINDYFLLDRIPHSVYI